jgi:hypothetical protein
MRVFSLLTAAGFVAVALALALTPKTAQAAEEPDPSGLYLCVGDAGNGKTYEGKVRITQEGDSYTVKWQIGDRQRYTGVGIREGDTLSVAIRDDNDDNYTAVIVYRIQRGGKLSGRWTVVGFKGRTYVETLIPAK